MSERADWQDLVYEAGDVFCEEPFWEERLQRHMRHVREAQHLKAAQPDLATFWDILRACEAEGWEDEAQQLLTMGNEDTPSTHFPLVGKSTKDMLQRRKKK